MTTVNGCTKSDFPQISFLSVLCSNSAVGLQ